MRPRPPETEPRHRTEKPVPEDNEPLRVDALRTWTSGVLQRAGLPGSSSDVVADLLIYSQRRGVLSHGLNLLEPYVDRIVGGGTNLQPHPVTTGAGAVKTVDGNGGIGGVACVVASDEAAELAEQHGIGMVVVRNSNHVGALAFYVERLVQRGLAAIVVSNADPSMVPPGGGAAVLGSNPLAIGVPESTTSGRLILDMATSAAAHGKIVTAARAGRPIPADWAVDEHGDPTTDPDEALRGALVPAAGPKGFGLAFMIDVLCAGLSGGPIGRDVVPLKAGTHLSQQVSLLIIAISPAQCAGAAHFDATTSALVDAVRSARSTEDLRGRPLVPGEPEYIRQQEQQSLVAVDAALTATLAALGERMQLPFPSLDGP